jgi:hypothetical protein
MPDETEETREKMGSQRAFYPGQICLLVPELAGH